ncbi:hypothetical protein FB45DRAFT_680634, partial [Roridomyces roridus]
GMTQYLVMMNDMPANLLKGLKKSMRRFINGGRGSAPISLEMLSEPIDKGGKNILDIEARNDAIALLKLRDFLDLSPRRTEWARIANRRLIKRDVKASKVAESSYVSPFLQSWAPNSRRYPKHMKTALKAADKYGIIFDTLDPPPEIQRALPMFHHFGQDSSKRKRNNGRVFECLRESHAVQTI